MNLLNVKSSISYKRKTTSISVLQREVVDRKYTRVASELIYITTYITSIH